MSTPRTTDTGAGLLPAARAIAESLQLVRYHVPVEVLCLPRWVGWDGTRRADGKLDKTPLNAHDGRKAKTNVPGTWGTFEQACELALRDPRVGGVGLVLTNSDYWALDLDHIINLSTGEVAQAARRFLASLTPTYVEMSPSGDGIHVLFRGQRPARLSATKAKDAFGPGMHLEVFGGRSARYLTMTGVVWECA